MKESEEAYNVAGPNCTTETPVELVTRNRSAKFDFVELQNKFKTICPDYGVDLEPDVVYKAVEFTSKMLYEVAPKSRKLDRNVVRTWTFSFPNANCTICPTLFVSTYRKTELSDCFVAGELLCCSVRQASLLAMDTFIKLGRNAYNNDNTIILTPLASDIFFKDDIPQLANELKRPVIEVIEVINSSCQSDGQYLALSEAAPALVASELATKDLEDRDVAASIISKLLREYKAHGKNMDPNDYEIYSKYANGGLPAGFSISLLIQKYEEIRLSVTRQTTSEIEGPLVPSASGTSSREDEVRQQPKETAGATAEESAGATAEESAVQYGSIVSETDDDVPSDNNA